MQRIPIMRPKLPTAERLRPYLERIDASRIYSNFGPLTTLFEERLSNHFLVAPGCVTTVTNATVGLALSLTAMGAKPGTLCMMPAWTFVASAHAARLAGLTPYFVDVDAESWALDPGRVDEYLICAPSQVGAIMPVAPFGRPLNTVAWDEVQFETGLPVVIDAAAGFDASVSGTAPIVVSLHATKVLGVGEGGFVMSTNAALIREIRSRSNFGFVSTREAERPATNAKLSEYHAAVGLSAMDQWGEVRTEWMAAGDAYQKALESNFVRFQGGFAQNWITSTCVLHLDTDAKRVPLALNELDIETRWWWGAGAHLHSATATFPRTTLPNTEALARSTIAVPFFHDISAVNIERVTAGILSTA